MVCVLVCDVEMTSVIDQRHNPCCDEESTAHSRLQSRDDDDVIVAVATAGATSCIAGGRAMASE